jgi:hypothetical protein
MEKSKAIVQQKLICEKCKEEIFNCDRCNMPFDYEQEIYCENGEHFCRTKL